MSLVPASASQSCTELSVYVVDGYSGAPISNALIHDLTTDDLVTTGPNGLGVLTAGMGAASAHVFEVVAAGYPPHFRKVELVAVHGPTPCIDAVDPGVVLRVCPESMYVSPFIGPSGGVFRFSHDTGQTTDGAPFLQNVAVEVAPGTWTARYRLGVTPVAHSATVNVFLPSHPLTSNEDVSYQESLAGLRMVLLDEDGFAVDIGGLPQAIRVSLGSARVDEPFTGQGDLEALSFDLGALAWDNAAIQSLDYSQAGDQVVVEVDRVRGFQVFPVGPSVGLVPEPGASTDLSIGDPFGDHYFCEWKLLSIDPKPCGTGTAPAIDSATYLCDPCGTLDGTMQFDNEVTYSVTVDSAAQHSFSATATQKVLELGFEASTKVGTKTTFTKRMRVTKSAGAQHPGMCGQKNLYPIETDYIYELICSGGVTGSEKVTVTTGSCWSYADMLPCGSE
ncbi:hypothetical protein [Planctomycetes bacterium Pla133]